MIECVCCTATEEGDELLLVFRILKLFGITLEYENHIYKIIVSLFMQNVPEVLYMVICGILSKEGSKCSSGQNVNLPGILAWHWQY